MMNERRREVLARTIARMTTYQPLSGKTVLEIGADKDGIAAGMLLDAGAARVISTNYGGNWPVETVGPLERRLLDARRMEDSLDAQSIDVIFGIAILEHIVGLPAFFGGAKYALRPGGLFFVHGGPIWTSPKGHHLFVDIETRQYRFGKPEANPIADWTHLTHDAESLAQDLIGRGVPPDDAAEIGRWTYENDRVNRVGFRDMCEMFAASGLNEEDRLLNAYAHPSSELREAIERGPWADQERYDVSGVTFVGRA